MKRTLITIIALLISTAAFAENLEINDTRIVDLPPIGESALDSGFVKALFEANKMDVDEYVNQCEIREQAFEMSDAQAQFLPLNLHGPDVLEVQHALQIKVTGACVDK